MAMEISNNYSSYMNTTDSKKKTTESGTAKETVETSAAQKKTDTEKKGSLLGRLQDKYSNFDITAGTFSNNQISSKSKGFQGVMINPAYLAKAENNEKTAKELDEMLSGVESAQKWLEDAFKRDGLELVSCGYFIDENGEMGSWSVVKKKDSMFDGLAEKSEKNADRIKEKQEKTREQKKTDEKKAEKKEAEEKQGQQVKTSKDKVVVVASSNEELLKKAKDAANGKNETSVTNEKVLAKEEKALGNNFDYSI